MISDHLYQFKLGLNKDRREILHQNETYFLKKSYFFN